MAHIPGSPTEAQTTREVERSTNSLQTYDRTLSIFCPPVPTPLAESAFHWGLDGDRRLVQMHTWPGTPAPWDTPTTMIRPSTGSAEPLLPPADADDELLLLEQEHEILPSAVFSRGNQRPFETTGNISHRPETASERPSTRGSHLTRSLTNAFRKRPRPLRTPVPNLVSASLPGTPITPLNSLQPPTPDPRNLKSEADSENAFLHERAGTTRATDYTTSASNGPQKKPTSPRRVTHFLWNGYRYSHVVQQPQNYVDQVGIVR